LSTPYTMLGAPHGQTVIEPQKQTLWTELCAERLKNRQLEAENDTLRVLHAELLEKVMALTAERDGLHQCVMQELSEEPA